MSLRVQVPPGCGRSSPVLLLVSRFIASGAKTEGTLTGIRKLRPRPVVAVERHVVIDEDAVSEMQESLLGSAKKVGLGAADSEVFWINDERSGPSGIYR